MIIRYARKISDMVAIVHLSIEPGDDDRLWSMLALCDKHFIDMGSEVKLMADRRYAEIMRPRSKK